MTEIVDNMMCSGVRHMYQNFHELHKGEQLKNNIWAIARAINNPTYIKAMENMKADSVGAYKWVKKWPPRTWIKAFLIRFQNVTSS